MEKIVVVGSGIAAVTAIDALRSEGFTGTITMIGEETHAPYARPPLSKGVLKKTESLESVTIPSQPDVTEIITGLSAVSLDPSAKLVTLEDGYEVSYDGLVIATGARARKLRPGADNELVLRGIDDAQALEARLASAQSVLIIGGGFLGMEIASTARSLGKDVTVVDIVPHLVRQFGSYLANHMTGAAKALGVDLRVLEGGIELLGETSVVGVRTNDGEEIYADMVVSAVGDVPNVEWLESAGLADPLGLAVDSRCRVSDTIVAAGDVVRVGDGRRTPHWGAAIDQARVAAAALLRGDEASEYHPTPYFWTEQWGLSLKICGEISDVSVPELIEGSWEENSLIIQYKEAGHGIAAASVNRRYPMMKLRKLAQPIPQ